MNAVFSAIRSRSTEKGYAKYKDVEQAITSLAKVHDSLYAQSNAVRANKDMSAHGQQKQLRKICEANVSVVQRQKRLVAQGRDTLAKRRADLRPKSTFDKTDFLATWVHIKFGEKIAAMDPLAAKALLLSAGVDQRMVAAALELPRELTGLTAETVAEVEATFLKQHHGKLLAQFEEESDALDLADQAVVAASEALFRTGGFGDMYEFSQFVAAHDKIDAKAETEEAERLATESVLAQAVALPLSNRIKLGGDLLDRNTADALAKNRAA